MSRRSSSGPLRRRAWRGGGGSGGGGGRGGAGAARRRRVAAGARVCRRDEHEARREDRGPLAAHDRDAAVLERLAEGLERRTRELGELVEEQDAVMGKARLARSRDRSAADEPGGGDLVVRGAE